jgi:hypothetical protein
MFINDTGCCAVMEIINLKFGGSPHSIMKRLDEEFYYDEIVKHEIPSFIIFTGVVGYTNSKVKPKYGPDFKKFILKNKLGTVTETQAAPNRVNHPSHLVKVWVWTPAPMNLKKWWRLSGGDK